MTKSIGYWIGAGGYGEDSFRADMSSFLRPSEVLAAGPVRWVTPAWSLTFPEVESGVQTDLLVGVSDLGINVWTPEWNGDHFRVSEHRLWRFADLSSVNARSPARRMVRPGFRRRIESVTLLQLWDRHDRHLFAESRYTESIQMVLQIDEKGKAFNRERLEVANRQAAERHRDGLSLSVELDRLAALYKSGAITHSEWERAKTLLIGPAPDPVHDAIDELSRLHHLLLMGTLSDYEFQRKKLELLTW